MTGKTLFGHAEDSIALVGGWDGAGGVTAKYTVAEPCDDGIAELAQGAGDTDQEVAEASPTIPGVAKDLQRANDGVRTAIEALMVGEGISDEDDALGGAGGGGHGDELLAKGALKRGEAEVAMMIVAEDETDDSVAEGTDAVVEENRATFDLGAFNFVHFGGRCGLLYCVDAA